MSEDNRLVVESGLFDKEFYETQSRAEFSGDVAAAEHFLQEGSAKGYAPGPFFSTIEYVKNNHDVAQSGQIPLVHFLRYGLQEGRYRRPAKTTLRTARSVTIDDFAQFSAQAHVKDDKNVVDVIMPVYKGRKITLSSIYSVLSSKNKANYRLIVINDSSPDKSLACDLSDLGKAGLIDLIENKKNDGFVKSCNKGLVRSDVNDAVLLNSDAFVYHNWIDRLRSVSTSTGNVSSVTPLSNNATIASYPRFVLDNWNILDVCDAELDRMLSATFASSSMEIPVGIGFCMYLTRKALIDVGLLDAHVFRKGYGEEVDWSRRAVEQGFRNLLAPGVFVTHLGGVSFGIADKTKNESRADRILERLHPGYGALIRRFVAVDPVKDIRERADRSRLRSHCQRPAVLLVCPKIGGGTERHLRELSVALDISGFSVLRCIPCSSDSSRIRLSLNEEDSLPNLPSYSIAYEAREFTRLLSDLGIISVHIHHLLGFDGDMGLLIAEVVSNLKCHLYITVHDYYYICPRVNLIDRSGLYCGEPDVSYCERCVATGTLPRSGRPIVRRWRDHHEKLLSSADLVFVPDDDVKMRILNYFELKNIKVRPHFSVSKEENVTPLAEMQIKTFQKKAEYTICLIGAIGPIKGSSLIEAVAESMHERHPAIEIIIIGYTDRDYQLRCIGNVHITGEYSERDISYLIQKVEPNLIWFSSVWPETFSYTLSHALDSGFPIAFFDFGAISRRARACNHFAIPLNFMHEIPLLVNFLCSVAAKERPPLAYDSPAVRSKNTLDEMYSDFMNDYYCV